MRTSAGHNATSTANGVPAPEPVREDAGARPRQGQYSNAVDSGVIVTSHEAPPVADGTWTGQRDASRADLRAQRKRFGCRRRGRTDCLNLDGQSLDRIRADARPIRRISCGNSYRVPTLRDSHPDPQRQHHDGPWWPGRRPAWDPPPVHLGSASKGSVFRHTSSQQIRAFSWPQLCIDIQAGRSFAIAGLADRRPSVGDAVTILAGLVSSVRPVSCAADGVCLGRQPGEHCRCWLQR